MGHGVSEETREKMREVHSAFWQTPEGRKARKVMSLRQKMRGPFSEETLRKLGDAARGRHPSAATREKMRASWLLRKRDRELQVDAVFV
jgi:hypothetical protein